MKQNICLTLLMVLGSFVSMSGANKIIPSFQSHDLAIVKAARDGDVAALKKAYEGAKAFVAVYPEKSKQLQGALNTALVQAAKNKALSDEIFSNIARNLITYGANRLSQDSGRKTIQYYRKSFGASDKRENSGERQYMGGDELEKLIMSNNS